MSNRIYVGGYFTDLNGNTRNRLVRLNQNGTEDTAFYTNLGTAFNDIIFTIRQQPDRKILVGGSFTTFNGNSRGALVRLNEDGTEDTTFATNLGTGFTGGTAIVRDILIQPDGKILVCGTFLNINGTTSEKIARLNSDGTRDTSFLAPGPNAFQFLDGVLALGLQSDGKIVAGGSFQTFNYITRNRLIRLNSDGTEDAAFYTNLGTGFNGGVTNLVIQSDDKIVVGGGFGKFNTNNREKLLRLNSDGTEDTAFNNNLGTGFGPGGAIQANGLTQQSDGKFIATGNYTVFNGNTRNSIVRLNQDGTEDTAFYSNLGTAFGSGAWTNDVQLDGRIVVGGAFTSFNGNTRNYIARLNDNGTEDTTFYSNLGTGFNFVTQVVFSEIESIPEPKFTIDTGSVFEGEGVCLAVKAEDFTKITSWTGSIQYDETIVSYVSASNNNINASIADIGGGLIGFAYQSTGSTLASGSTVFELCFDGIVTGSSSIEFTSSILYPLEIQYSSSVISASYGSGSIEVIQFCSNSLYTFYGSAERYNHDLGTKYIVANLYDNNLQVFPNSLTSTTNYTDFDFSTPINGWIVVKEADYSQSFSSQTSVNVSHSLNTEDIIVQTFDENGELFIANSVTISGSNNVIVDFAGIPLSGFVSVLSGLYSEEFTNVTESFINHNLGNKNQLIAIYESGSQVYPDSIDLINDYTTSVSFSVPTTGKIVMNRVCDLVINRETEIFIGSDIVTESVSTCLPVTVGYGFQNVLTWQGTIQYNSILLDFVSESNDNLGITLFEPSSGSLTFSWISPYLTGSTFSSGSTLFELCFNTTGSGLAGLEFTGSPTLLEMSDQSGSIFDVTYYTGSIIVLEATSSTENVTLYLYQTSSEAEFFDIYYGDSISGPWYLADSGSNVNLYADYSYTVPILSGSNYLKLVNKNPTYFPDNFKIHDLNFGEPAKGTTPPPTPEFTTQSLGGDIDLVNDTGGAISIKGLYLQTSGGFTASTDQIPPIINMNTGDTYSFSIPAVTGSNVDILEELNLVVEIAGDQTSIITGSYSDGGSAFLYPAAFYSGSTYAGGPDTTTTIFTFNTNTSVTDTSQIRAIGTATL